MREPIAIVGMACRFPKANSPEAYWSLLRDKVEAVGEPPHERAELTPPAWLFDHAPSCGRGGFLEDLDLFEPAFFRLSPREAARMDPQQRLLLELAWEALEDAGQPIAPLAASRTGVFIGIMNADFARKAGQNLEQLDAQLGPGSSLAIAANRISFVHDLRGPSMAIDTLCSSSLVAIHLACQSLQLDESAPVAIAGGVNVILDRTMDVFYARAGLISADGRCRAFDANARGIVRGEGGGLVVLKRLSNAVADGDHIHAVILGSAVNQDGRSNGLTSPSRWSQEEVLRAAYERAGVKPGSVSYVETHGTGTLIGDPIEAAALGAVLGKDRSAPCAIGSVKTNLGHLESAAGIASLIKAVLSISNRTIVPNLHFDAPNPYARLAERKLFVPTESQIWAGDVAGVSSFGMGGTNAHVVLGAPPPAPQRKREREPERAELIVMSARTLPALDSVQRSYSMSSAALADVAYSAGARRSHHDHRRAIVATSVEDAAAQLRRDTTIAGRVVPGRTHRLVFVVQNEAIAAQWRALGFEPDAEIQSFEDATSNLGEESTVFIEMSDTPTLQEQLRAIGGTALWSGTDRVSALKAIGELYCLGYDIDWKLLHADDAALVSLGSYPWQRERCWLDVKPQQLLLPRWEHAELAPASRTLTGEWLVVGSSPLAAIVAKRLEEAGYRVSSSSKVESGAWRGVVYAGDLAGAVQTVQSLSQTRTRLWFITRGAQIVAPGDALELEALEQATLWGFGRVVANEYPRLRCTLLDLPPQDEALDSLMYELLSSSDETEIAYRKGERFVGRLGSELATLPTTRLELARDAAYLVTGGLGGLGLSAAKLLVDRGARRLVLLGRRGVETDAQRTALSELSAGGARVTVEQADVAERAALDSLVRRHPNIRGVVHAAGVMSPAMVATIDPASLDGLLAAKIAGARNLHDVLGRDLDFFVAYSSIATQLGTPGQGVYAAANAYLDVLAQYRRARGEAALSVAWTVIEDTGMAASASSKQLRQLADRGLGTLTARKVSEVLEQLLVLDKAAAPCLAVAPFDVQKWTAFYPASPRLSGNAAEPVHHLRKLPAADRSKAIETYLCNKIAAVLHHPASEVETWRSLDDLGLDSLTAVELQSLIESELEVSLPLDRLLGGATLQELAAIIATQLSGQVAATNPPPPLRRDAVLDAKLTYSGKPVSARRDIFLTGATGFLGAFLLSELLSHTRARIHCLVRAGSPNEGLHRLSEVMRRYSLPELNERVVCVPGDLALPQFGVPSASYEQLAGSIDAVFHNGASVNFIFPYEKLKGANVAGTEEVLRFAACGKPKQLHYVSTIGVFAGQQDLVKEEERGANPESLPLGYMQAKWVAEELVMQARDRGLETAIYRPGTISGHTMTGAFNPDDFLCVLIKGCLELGIAPAVDVTVNLAPVDYVSRAIVGLATNGSGNYHLVNSTVFPFRSLNGWIRQLGYPLAEVPYEKWRNIVLEKGDTTALAALLPLFTAHEDTDWLRFPDFDTSRTREALGASVTCPPIDIVIMRRYFERFVAAGFIPPPPGGAFS